MAALSVPAARTSATRQRFRGPEAKPSFWSRIRAGISRIGSALVGGVRAAGRSVRIAVDSASTVLRDPLQMVRMLGSLKRLLLLGAGVGSTVAILSYRCPHFVSAAVSGIGAAATAVGVQIGVWARRAFHTISVS